MTDDTGAGVELRFTEPVSVSFGETMVGERYVAEYIIRQLKVHLPAQWAAGDRTELEYEIVPFAASNG